MAMLPISVAVLAWTFRRHGQPLPLALSAVALAIGYVHFFAGTPEWTLYGVLALSLAAAIWDWRASRAPEVRLSSPVG